MCLSPDPNGGNASALAPVEPAKKIKQGPMGVDLGNLTALGQRQLALPGRRQFGSVVGVTVGPPKDISRQQVY